MAKGALPLEQTVTIINNSGKLISTGKHLVSIWKEAQSSYREKKAELKQERSVQRSQTFDQSRSLSRRHHHHRHDDLKSEHYDDDKRSRRTYDEQSVASSRRSHASRSTHSRHHKDQLALTENNLKTLSEVSSTAPSRPPVAYRSPYAETRGVVSRADLDRAELRSVAPTERTQLPRMRSDSELAVQKRDADKEIDMHLAYGDIPPDLATRTDLDPKSEEEKTEQLVHKIEDLLDEAHCAQHSATAIIKHLQERPDAAAAVALTLAELSSLVAKVSPAFVTFLKGGSPAVFALLASPQFLIGTGIAVGVTIVMFGGWKIIQKVAEDQMARGVLSMEQAPPPVAHDGYDNGVDEALVLEKMEEELSTIETWRRGIVPESADLELITPQADRATRERRAARDPKDPMDDFDSRSRRSTRTHKTSKTHKSHRSSKHDKDSPDKKSSRDDAASVASSGFTKKSSSKKKELKAIDDGRSVKSEELPFRPRPRVHNNMLKALFKNKKEQSEAVFA